MAVAKANRDAQLWQRSKRDLTAPGDGKITEIFRREGEIAGRQAPVLSLLPDGAVHMRLYVPETFVADITLGVNCGGCPHDATAIVSYVSDEPEFTPPVIYSLQNRQKLVYLIEARPDVGADVLKPGQIIDASLMGVP